MNRFIDEVLSDLRMKFGDDLSKIKIVDPSNFLQVFCDACDTLRIADDKTLVGELYEIYKVECESRESFADFQDFGEILVSDFKEIDKSLADCEGIFRNVAELKNESDLSYLSDEQKTTVSRFFNFDANSRSMKIWQKMNDIYIKFKRNLREKNLAYDGMLMREVAQNTENYAEKFAFEKYAFVGFFDFCEAEKKLVNFLKTREKTCFYWDYDNFFAKENEESGLTEYVKYFGDDLNCERNNFEKEKKISFYEAANSFSQIEIADKILGKIDDKNDVAVILCDEKLLASVKNSIDERVCVFLISQTQNLDFKNLIILSANEGYLPKSEAANTTIPQFVRKAFAMSGVSRREFFERYLFFRLISRGENIAFLYNIGKNSFVKGEASRFLRRLEWEYMRRIEKFSPKIELLTNSKPEPVFIEKTTEILESLRKKYLEKPLSPSAFNVFIDCSLQFYFKYVLKIVKPDDETELNSAVLGNIFHKTMELLYSQNLKNAVEDSMEKAFEEVFFKAAKSRDEYSGEEMIFFKVISRMAQNTLSYDEKYAPFEILGLEEEFYFEKNGIKIGGIIDRIDKKGRIIRVVDYKTGKVPERNDFESEIQNLFSNRRAKKANYQFQAYLYSSLLAQDEKYSDFAISPNLIFTLSADNGIYTFTDDFRQIKKEFDEKFEKKLAELFDSQIPFSQREKDDNCNYCDYRGICGRD
jgi:hypothetical protein